MGLKGRLGQAGPSTRTYEMQRAYNSYQAEQVPGECAFCSVPEGQTGDIVEEGTAVLVVQNRFGYAVWDGCAVLEHLMVIPREHRNTLGSFTKEELHEWTAVCSRYEADGYSLYTRSPDNITKSVAHHHTHFIRLGKRRKKWIFYLRKPHILLTR